MDGDVELIRCRGDGDQPGGLLNGKHDFGDGSVVRKCWGIERERAIWELGRMQEILFLLRMVHRKEKVVTKR